MGMINATHLIPNLEDSAVMIQFNPPWLFDNMSTYRIMQWLNTGSSVKSEGEATQLVEEVLNAPDFDIKDLSHFSAHRENLRADEAKIPESASNYLSGFETTSVDIRVLSGQRNVPSEMFSVLGLHYRPLLSVIREAFLGPLSNKIHFSPFKLFHQLPSSTEEILVAAVMLWSDATHVANFGTAKMWPIYLMLGNISKYIRAFPDSGACHHLAYIPSLPDSFHDFAMNFHVKWKTQKASILTHCRRELMHSVWKFLLTDDFIHAYRYGIVIECGDGVKRRIYPHFFTYSADYPEKVLLATIRDKGICPCPRCLVQKDALDQMGLVRDIQICTRNIRTYFVNKVNRARHFIYSMGHPINGVHVENLLKESSSVPTEVNQDLFRTLLWNALELLVIDFLHEFELRVWKTLFKHLIQLLYSLANGTEKVTELDSRFRCMSTFRMKRLAARDFEDLLQCSIPTFEGLLPGEHDTRLMKLLYRLAEWHALAKLRMHTDLTLTDLSSCTAVVGTLMREFRDKTCSQFRTVELPSEQQARSRRQAQIDAQRHSADPSMPSQRNNTSRKARTLNLFTYKFHAMADYVPAIRWFGTIDSYSTQIGELAHRLVKHLYGLTNKRQHEDQIARRYKHSRMLANAQFAKKKANLKGKTRAVKSNIGGSCNVAHDDGAHAHQVGFGEGTTSEDLDIPLDVHHFISNRRDHPVHLTPFPLQQHSDPATKNFVSKLEDHLLGRLKEILFDGNYEFTAEEQQDIIIAKDKIHTVKTLRINYTTYNVRRNQDVINPRTDHSTIMLKSPDTNPNAHPYWYAQVLGIFHADVIHFRSRKRMEFLWVRWLGTEPDYRPGQKFAKLPKVGFVPEDDEFAFGFLDPSQVIRACDLIPAFIHGKSNDLLATRLPTAARKVRESEDWVNYYVMIFVDCDMFMHYHGGAIGHIDIQRCGELNPITEGDEDNDDISEIHFTGPEDIIAPNLDSDFEDDSDGLNNLADNNDSKAGSQTSLHSYLADRSVDESSDIDNKDYDN
ncbi:hypothetical protein EV359DRAFT_75796 [Lentinula novae-zelandiae]|nr:hypothetical protein EV359DRAFT_75796 [Lentinula novae-zelandiae]